MTGRNMSEAIDKKKWLQDETGSLIYSDTDQIQFWSDTSLIHIK